MAQRLPVISVLVLYIASIVYSDILSGIGNNLFGHKCSYFWRHQNVSMKTNALMSVTNKKGDTCKAIQLNYISRHGARYPATGDFKYFDKLKNKILHHSGKLSQFQFVKDWQNYPPKAHGHVEDLGRWELQYLGHLYGLGLYDLFNNHISPQTIKLTGTHKQRTRTSSSEFYKGLTEVITGKRLSDIKPITNDAILRYFECPNYESKILNNKTHMHQHFAFENSSRFQQVVKDVSERLGMNTTMTVDDMKMMFMICATELAVRNNSDWCTLQTEKEREIVNYASDLEDYYSLLYGDPMIQKMTCPLWQDIFTSLGNAINKYESNQTYLLGDLRFGHSDTMDPFYSSIGLFKDSIPPRADNFLAMGNRKFYESKITTFSAHVAFILYNCGGSGPQNYRLKMMVNGEAMRIPGCDSDLCPYLKVRNLYSRYIDECHWKDLCTVRTNSPIVVG